MNFLNLIGNNAYFLEKYMSFYKDNDITNPFYEKTRLFLENEIFELKESSKYISSLDKIGVIHSSDLLTYYYVSRLLYSFEEIYKDSRKSKYSLKDEVIDLYFGLINFLLLTNIFPPNEDIDKYDIGNGKYEEIHKSLRLNLIKELLPKQIKSLNDELFNKFVESYFQFREIKKIFGVTTSSWKDLFGKAQYDRKKIEEYIKEKDIDYFKDNKKIFDFCKEETPPFLLKNVGLASELFVLLYLLSLNCGYVIPLLLHQRIFSNFKDLFSEKSSYNGIKEKFVMIPTDFLLLKKGRTFALELGRGKTELISTLASISGIPTIFIDVNSNLGPKLGYKCNYCFTSFTVCQKYIDNFKKGTMEQRIESCSGCNYLSDCQSKVYQYTLKAKPNIKKHIHCSCYDQMTPVQKDLIEVGETMLPSYPIVKGLDKLELGF